MSVEIQYPCEPLWFIFWIYKDKDHPGIGLVGDGFDAAG